MQNSKNFKTLNLLWRISINCKISNMSFEKLILNVIKSYECSRKSIKIYKSVLFVCTHFDRYTIVVWVWFCFDGYNKAIYCYNLF